jgi:hypothetical protein
MGTVKTIVKAIDVLFMRLYKERTRVTESSSLSTQKVKLSRYTPWTHTGGEEV